jgi:hypothetical protein
MRQGKVIGVLLLLLAAAPPLASQVSVVAPNEMEVQMTARMEPGSVRVPSAVVAVVTGRYHRVVLDRGQRRFFAYDVFVEPKTGSQTLQVRIEPFSLSAADFARVEMIDASWTYMPLYKYPVVPEVRAGDTVAIDLLENPATGQKVVDYLVFKRSTPANADRAPLEDLSLAAVELQLENCRISVNGTMLDASTRLGGSISGAALWFYLPDRGRFAMSLVPHSNLGFLRAGEVSNRSLTFSDGNERYEIQSTSRIVPAGGRYNLYVRHDTEWRPAVSEAKSPVILGAADRAEWLTAK